MQVKDVMSRQVISIEPSDSCLEAVGRMHRSRVRHLPVVDRGAASVADLMTTDVVTVGPDETLGEAARLMLERKGGSRPVLEDGRVVGILTETDMLRLSVRSDAGAPECAEVIVSFPS